MKRLTGKGKMNEKGRIVIIIVISVLFAVFCTVSAGFIFYDAGHRDGLAEDTGGTGELGREFDDSQRRAEDRDREASGRLELARARTARTTADLHRLGELCKDERGLLEALTKEVDILESYFGDISGIIFDPWNSADSEEINGTKTP
jgi:hypothetical protein